MNEVQVDARGRRMRCMWEGCRRLAHGLVRLSGSALEVLAVASGDFAVKGA